MPAFLNDFLLIWNVSLIKSGEDLSLTAKLSYLLENSDYYQFDAYGYNAVVSGRTISLDNYSDSQISSNAANEVTNNFKFNYFVWFIFKLYLI